MSKILFVMTAADRLTLKTGAQHPTGFWAEEFAAPYERFKKAGFEIEVATPGGQAPPVDSASLSGDNAHWGDVLKGAQELTAPRSLADVEATDYAAIFIPGGHGPMEDLSRSPEVGRLLTQAHSAGLVTAAVCHGPAALLSARELYAGYKVTSFSNQEENLTPVAGQVPFDLETELVKSGAEFSQAAPWAPYVVEDRELITGQNPASSGLIADHVVRRLGRS